MSEGSIHIMFRSLTHEDALKRLPFWFGDGIDALEVNLSVCWISVSLFKSS